MSGFSSDMIWDCWLRRGPNLREHPPNLHTSRSPETTHLHPPSSVDEMNCIRTMTPKRLAASRQCCNSRAIVGQKSGRLSSVLTAAAKTDGTQLLKSVPSIAATAATYLASALPAMADGGSPFDGVQANSLYVTGGLILMCIPGACLWL